MASREETNFTRLLHRCETMATERKYDDWRLEKYVGTLQDYLQKLRILSANKPAQEVLAEYTRKVDFLKGLIDAEKLPTSCERVLAADLLTPGLRSGEPNLQSKELHLQTKARYQEEARNNLLSATHTKASEEQNNVRQRKGVSADRPVSEWPSDKGAAKATSVEEDIDTVIKHQQELQEKLAEEMVFLAKNMKEHASAANRIVKADNKRLEESNKLAEVNQEKLKVESGRLEEHVNKSCNWWIWLMMAAVCITFVWMVVFMRMFPKR